MQFALFSVFLALACAGCCCAGPIATFAPGGAGGLDTVDTEDGRFETRLVDGRQAVRLQEGTTPPSNYLYFAFTPEVRSRIGSEVYIVVDFYDECMNVVRVQFNSMTSNYTEVRGFLTTGTGQWTRAIIHLADTDFRGQQNGGADFRLANTGPATVARIEVHTEKPDVDVPSERERVRAAINPTGRPKDMYYTFGNDADDSTAVMYRALGVTSIESYVTWETCEGKGEGQWDWSH